MSGHPKNYGFYASMHVDGICRRGKHTSIRSSRSCSFLSLSASSWAIFRRSIFLLRKPPIKSLEEKIKRRKMQTDWKINNCILIVAIVGRCAPQMFGWEYDSLTESLLLIGWYFLEAIVDNYISTGFGGGLEPLRWLRPLAHARMIFWVEMDTGQDLFSWKK